MLVDFPPFGIMDANNQPDGTMRCCEAACQGARSRSDESCRGRTQTAPPPPPLLPAATVDLLVASLGITEERAKNVRLLATYAAFRSACRRADLTSQSLKIWPQDDRRRPCQHAGHGDHGRLPLRSQHSTLRRRRQCVQALLSGQVELIGVSNVVAAQIEAAAPGRFNQKLQLSQQVQGIAVRKGSTRC